MSFLDTCVTVIATKMGAALAERLEPIVIAAVERALARSGTKALSSAVGDRVAPTTQPSTSRSVPTAPATDGAMVDDRDSAAMTVSGALTTPSTLRSAGVASARAAYGAMEPTL